MSQVEKNSQMGVKANITSQALTKIKMKSFDSSILEVVVQDVIEALRSAGSRFSGPIFLPTRKIRRTLLSGPHIDKKARDQFEIRVHSRLLCVHYSDDVMKVLKKLNVPSGVDISIAMGRSS